MKIVTEQLWALVNAQKSSRPDLKKRLVRNEFGECLPTAYLQAYGERNTASGRWRYLPTPPFMLAWNLLRAQGNTQWRNQSGIDGLTTRQMRDRWSRFSSIIPANHMDNHRFGESPDAFQRLRWRGSWQRRRTQGWSMSAFWFIALWRETRKEHEGWAIGCPRWYTDHQP
jgi:hypothetical protein